MEYEVASALAGTHGLFTKMRQYKQHFDIETSPCPPPPGPAWRGNASEKSFAQVAFSASKFVKRVICESVVLT